MNLIRYHGGRLFFTAYDFKLLKVMKYGKNNNWACLLKVHIKLQKIISDTNHQVDAQNEYSYQSLPYYGQSMLLQNNFYPNPYMAFYAHQPEMHYQSSADLAVSPPMTFSYNMVSLDQSTIFLVFKAEKAIHLSVEVLVMKEKSKNFDIFKLKIQTKINILHVVDYDVILISKQLRCAMSLV